MIAADPLGLLRRLINDPNTPSGPRYSDACLLDFLSEGQMNAVRETSAPKAYQVFSTQNVLTLTGTPTTGENFVMYVNQVQISVPETTGQSLSTLAGLVTAAVEANAGVNAIVNASQNAAPNAASITFSALGTGFTSNSAVIHAVQGVFVQSFMAYTQEYQVYEQLLTDAIYCAGKLLTPSSPAILEGWNIGLWSQGSCGTTPFPGSGAVPGTVGQGAPDWVNAWPQVYPSHTGAEHGFKPTVQPYSGHHGNGPNGPFGPGPSPPFPGPGPGPFPPGEFPGRHLHGGCQAERYYFRDPGTLGIVPAPANVCQVVIYGVCVPPPIVASSQTLIVPQSYRMYIVRYAEWLCRSSENTTNPGQQILIENAYNDMLRERASCILKVRNGQGKVPRTFNSIPQRLSRARYCVRRSGGGAGW